MGTKIKGLILFSSTDRYKFVLVIFFVSTEYICCYWKDQKSKAITV